MTGEPVKSYFGRPRAEVEKDLKAAEAVICPLCKIPPKPFAVDYQGFQLCKCGDCGLEFVSPRLTFEQLAESIYTEQYYSRSDETRPAETAAQYTRQLETLEGYLGDRRQILDVGCGDGDFLDFARSNGWIINGMDIGLSDGARALHCPLWEGRLQEIDFGDNKFDAIRMHQVLEHTQDPLGELERSRKLLNHGGVLYISVPNIAGLSPRVKSFQSRYGLKAHRWRHYAAMHHLFFFSPKTLTRLLESAGFHVLRCETTVNKKTGQNQLLAGLYKLALEPARMSSILDFYCTPQV